MGLIPNQLNNKTMNPYIIQSSLYLSTIYEAIIAKQEILRVKMQQYNDVKLYLFSFILPEYSSNEYIKNSLEKPRDFDPFGQTGFAHLWLQYD